MESILLVGSSGHAKVTADIVEKEGRYQIVGLIDAFRSVGEKTLGYSVLGAEMDLPKLSVEYDVKGLIIGIGDNSVRARIAGHVADICPGLAFVSAVHPSASVGKESTIGVGTVVMAGAVVNPCCQVGRF